MERPGAGRASRASPPPVGPTKLRKALLTTTLREIVRWRFLRLAIREVHRAMTARTEGPAARASRHARTVRKRWHQVVDVWKRDGPAHVAARVLGPVARRITRLNDVLEVRPADVRAADLELPTAWRSSTAPAGGPYTVNWVTTPPSAGSGGHTTMFRLISHLTAQGHRCRIYLYDVYGGDLAYNEAMLRDGYPNIHCEVHDATRRHGRCRRRLRHQLAHRVRGVQRSVRGEALLPRPGLRAVLLSQGDAQRAGGEHVPDGLPRGDRRAMAGGAAGT